MALFITQETKFYLHVHCRHQNTGDPGHSFLPQNVTIKWNHLLFQVPNVHDGAENNIFLPPRLAQHHGEHSLLVSHLSALSLK